MHDGDSLGVFSAKLSVNEEVDEIVFSSFLESLDGKTLESNILFVVSLNKFSDELGEWKFSDQEIGSFLVLLDFTCCYGSLLRSSDFLDTSLGGASSLTHGFTGDSLTWCFSCGSRFFFFLK